MGSEMCIRDRAGGGGSGWTRARGAQPVRGSATRWSVPAAMGWSCLLYTSDAADERSSVDLGGRRIIKKKNTVTLQRQAHA